MSATIGTGLSGTISRSARDDGSSGTETRTISAPASAAACTCATVAATSVVGVLVMVCTVIGAPPPTGTGPTMICRDWRRSILRHGRMGLCVMAGPAAVRCSHTRDSPSRRDRQPGLLLRLLRQFGDDALQVVIRAGIGQRITPGQRIRRQRQVGRDRAARAGGAIMLPVHRK